MTRTAVRAAIGLALAAACANRAIAGEMPLWEAGVGLGVLSVPDYRGSDQSHSYLLPVPYIVYRGDVLKADRNGARAEFLDLDRVKLELSLNASVPTASNHNDARRGMSDLKSTVEIGPTLDLTLFESGDRHVRVELRLPVRAALTVQSRPKTIGFIASPNLNLDLGDLAGGWNVGLLAGPLFGTHRFHDYFYTVPARDATPERPEYRAGGGYSGTQALAALSRRFSKIWVGAFVRFDTLHGAAFEDSPLVRRDHAVAAGLAVSWILGESDRRVNVED